MECQWFYSVSACAVIVHTGTEVFLRRNSRISRYDL